MTEEKDKTCPYCAETIKQEAIKCRYCNELLTNDKILSNSGGNLAFASCSNCNVQLTTKEVKKTGFSASKMIGILMLLIGILLLFVSVLLGVIFTLIGLRVLLSRETIMVCSECEVQHRTT